MNRGNYHEFGQFLHHRRRDLKRIANKTQGEYQLADVESVAWLMAQDMYSAKGIPVDFPNQNYQEHLLAFIYQKLVRYTETQVRHAIRLDHGQTDDDEGEHPLMRTLASNDGRDPLAELIALEDAASSQEVDACYSLAGAYAYLLHQFDNKIQAVADFLLISASEVRRRYTHAMWLARHQLPVPLNHAGESGFRLRAWRRFRFQQIPTQLELPLVFDEELKLEY